MYSGWALSASAKLCFGDNSPQTALDGHSAKMPSYHSKPRLQLRSRLKKLSSFLGMQIWGCSYMHPYIHDDPVRWAPMPMTSGARGSASGETLESALDGCLVMIVRVGRG